MGSERDTVDYNPASMDNNTAHSTRRRFPATAEPRTIAQRMQWQMGLAEATTPHWQQ